MKGSLLRKQTGFTTNPVPSRLLRGCVVCKTFAIPRAMTMLPVSHFFYVTFG